MGHAWLNITYFGDDEFKAEVARRNGSRPAALATTPAGPQQTAQR